MLKGKKLIFLSLECMLLKLQSDQQWLNLLILKQSKNIEFSLRPSCRTWTNRKSQCSSVNVQTIRLCYIGNLKTR
jgi:hypothetical protein